MITEIGNLAPSNSDIYTVVSGLVYDGTDYRAIIDIDDTQEITAFEHILVNKRKCTSLFGGLSKI